MPGSITERLLKDRPEFAQGHEMLGLIAHVEGRMSEAVGHEESGDMSSVSPIIFGWCAMSTLAGSQGAGSRSKAWPSADITMRERDRRRLDI